MVSFILPGNSASTGYEVANSLRFETNTYLQYDISSGGNARTWTYSFWTKRTKLGSWMNTHNFGGTGNRDYGAFDSSDRLEFAHSDSGYQYRFITNRVFRDVSAWYHIVIAMDTTQSTEANRTKIYVNGVQETSFNTATYPSQNHDTRGSQNRHMIGSDFDPSNYYSGYQAENVFINGLQLGADSFGEFDADSSIWKPKNVSGLTFGTNGFYLEYKQSGTSQNSSGMGADTSGNDNHFAVNNLTATDQSTDTCTNNAVTFTATHPTANNFTISEGGLKINKSGSGTFGLYGSSIMLSSGKWYWEVKFTGDAGSDRTRAGIAHYDSVSGTSTIQDSYSGFEFTCTTSGRFSFTTVGGSATEINGFNGYSTGDIIRFALDMDNQRLYVGRNADWFNYSSSNTGGDPTSGSGWLINDTTILKAPQTIYAGHAVGVSGSSELEFNFGATNTFTVSSGNSDGNGYGNFEFAVPSGYYAINTKNLAEYG